MKPTGFANLFCKTSDNGLFALNVSVVLGQERFFVGNARTVVVVSESLS